MARDDARTVLRGRVSLPELLGYGLLIALLCLGTVWLYFRNLPPAPATAAPPVEQAAVAGGGNIDPPAAAAPQVELPPLQFRSLTCDWRYELKAHSRVSDPLVLDDGTLVLRIDERRIVVLAPDGGLRYSYESPYGLSAPARIYDLDVVVVDGGKVLHLDGWGDPVGSYEHIDKGCNNRPGVSPTFSVYVPGFDGVMRCLDGNGKLRWSCDCHGRFGRATPMPLADGGVLAVSKGGELLRIDGRGQLLEAVDLSLSPERDWSVDTRPRGARKGAALYAYGGDWELLALDSAGKLLWTYDLKRQPKGTPIVGADGRIFCSAGQDIFCLDPSGCPLWSKRMLGGFAQETLPAAQTDGGLIFNGSDGELHLLDNYGRQYCSSQTEGLLALLPDGRLATVSSSFEKCTVAACRLGPVQKSEAASF